LPSRIDVEHIVNMKADSIISLRPVAPSPSGVPLAKERLPLGIAGLDEWLVGGLRRDALHEAYATAREDAAGAMALALLVAWLHHAQNPAGAIIWARELSSPSLPYGPGLIELGIDPAVITLLLLPDSRAVLRAALDSVRQGAAGAVLIELSGRQPLLDLTATRRLAWGTAPLST
jgi:protein ImuA